MALFVYVVGYGYWIGLEVRWERKAESKWY